MGFRREEARSPTHLGDRPALDLVILPRPFSMLGTGGRLRSRRYVHKEERLNLLYVIAWHALATAKDTKALRWRYDWLGVWIIRSVALQLLGINNEQWKRVAMLRVRKFILS